MKAFKREKVEFKSTLKLSHHIPVSFIIDNLLDTAGYQ